MRTGELALAALVACLLASPGRAHAGDDSERDRRVASIDNVITIVTEKLVERRTDFERTLGLVYRLLRSDRHRPWSERGIVARRTWRRAWLERVLEIKRIELTALEGELDLVEGNRRQELIPGRSKSSLELVRPVSGSVVSAFGRYRHRSGARLFRSGVELRTDVGAEIRAPIGGVVDYVGNVRGIGPSLILSGQNGERVILGPLRPSVTTGLSVLRSSALGTARSKRLYLEVRVGAGAGRAVDPVQSLHPPTK